MSKIKNFIKSKKNQKILILMGIFISIFILNALTPLIADDYSYSFGKNGEKITNLLDIITSQINHYFTWGGRSVAHSLAQFFLMFPKYIFNLLNSAIYVVLVYLIYLHVKMNKEDKPLMLLLIHFALWFLIPTFGQTAIWLTGSCNYLWTMTIMLLFLYLVRKNSNEHSLLKNIAILLLGIIAGWTNENTSFGLITAIIGFMILEKYKHTKISNYQKCALIGNIIGFIILIIAPGNFIRETYFQDNTPFITKIIQRIIDNTINFVNYCLPLFICIVILISIYMYKNKKINYSFIIFLIASFFTVYSMILSPTFPPRAWFGVIVFSITAFITLLYNIYDNNKFFRYIFYNLIIISSLYFISDYLLAFNDINNLQNTWEKRILEINQTENKEKIDFEFYNYHSSNSHNPIFGLTDLHTNKKEWPNLDIAKYYNIKSIKSIE